MLVLILIDVQYLQKAVFSFGKGSYGQNYFSSGSQNPPIKPPHKIFCPPPPPPPTLTPLTYLENPASLFLIISGNHIETWLIFLSC